jgi:hypothetical protein
MSSANLRGSNSIVEKLGVVSSIELNKEQNAVEYEHNAGTDASLDRNLLLRVANHPVIRSYLCYNYQLILFPNAGAFRNSLPQDNPSPAKRTTTTWVFGPR